ncbi:hypothetical protein CHS0354_032595 [Potamilus streckersoni]|uniref:Uncharacterized protein n=1 Tax=Potamilus streckersoni TaxID=2493646 RepID=A0AAE0T919_9BIVA|nr:hypothetical protein CHS0354_032595 [Potamilus streckersoni]
MTFITLSILFGVMVLSRADDCSQGITRCLWEAWNPWGSCSVSCGMGITSRSRGLCCKEGQEFNACIKECGITNEAFDQKECNESCEGDCFRGVGDMLFLLDSSGSISPAQFEKIKSFVKTVINSLDIFPNHTRVAVATFSQTTNFEFHLGQHNSAADLFKAIDSVTRSGEGTRLSAALETIFSQGFQGAREGVPKIIVLITDGHSKYPALARVLARRARNDGFLIYTVGIGNQTDDNELWHIASSPEDRFFFRIDDPNYLKNIKESLDKTPCKETISNNTLITDVTTESPNENATCVDTAPDCVKYGKDVCTDYSPWAHAHCELYCGFCQGKPTKPALCVDKNHNCASYGKDVCTSTSYIGWVQENCQKFCGICHSDAETTFSFTIATTTATKICEDVKSDCDGYKHACQDKQFEAFLRANCPATCGFCQSHKIINGTVHNGVKCPEWKIPAECIIDDSDPNCCPFPVCPESYKFTAEKLLM